MRLGLRKGLRYWFRVDRATIQELKDTAASISPGSWVVHDRLRGSTGQWQADFVLQFEEGEIHSCVPKPFVVNHWSLKADRVPTAPVNMTAMSHVLVAVFKGSLTSGCTYFKRYVAVENTPENC